VNHACPSCGTTTTKRGRCTACQPKATPEANKRKRDRPTYKTVYHTHRWKKLRLLILRRDSHTCKVCGQRGATVGHILPFTDYRDPLAWDPRNLRCECITCNSREAGKRGNPKKRGTLAA
jgi:5-methylcytosine-specific restriction protein A